MKIVCGRLKFLKKLQALKNTGGISFSGATSTFNVLTANAKDGGNRKFILIETEDYADTLTAERVRRVATLFGASAESGALGSALRKLRHPSRSNKLKAFIE